MKTDMTEAALDLLKESRIKRVHVVGRRGPLEVAFTIKELREMVNLKGCTPRFDPSIFEPIKALLPGLQRPRKRLTELLVKTALEAPTDKQRELWGQGVNEWHLNLFRTPLKLLPSSSDPDRVGAIKLGVNRSTAACSDSVAVEKQGFNTCYDTARNNLY